MNWPSTAYRTIFLAIGVDLRYEQTMNILTIPSHLPASAPELARRLGMILAGVVAVVARRFLREPKLMALTVPLCGWLGRTAQRFARAMTRPVVVRPARVGRKTGGVGTPAAARLPARKAWLLKALGWEVAVYGGYLQDLLAEPDMQAVLTAMPALGRLLRPLCRMLMAPDIVVPVLVAPKQTPVPAVRPEPPWPAAEHASLPAEASRWPFPETSD